MSTVSLHRTIQKRYSMSKLKKKLNRNKLIMERMEQSYFQPNKNLCKKILKMVATISAM